MDKPILKIKNLSKRYGDNQLFRDINLDVKPGEILGIIGASGSGKTTLLHTIIGFIRPDSGSVNILEPNLVSDDSDLVYSSVEKSYDKMKRMYGFASQTPSFYEKLTVEENLYYFGRLYGLSKQSVNANVKALLKLLGLDTSRKILGANLSGGMERRLDIACSLVHNPDILILDEPTADLDPVLRNNIWKLVQKINSKGTTIILSSHHLNELETLCDRIAILKDNEIVGVGSYEELSKEFTRGYEIRVQSYPGEYEKIKKIVKKEFKKEIDDVLINDHSIVIMSDKSQKILSKVIRIIKKEEKILEVTLAKPNLDQIFIGLSKKEEKK